jgi:Asp-tRNA(Asn)/Glu-tRNA(Gln) amidotransferase A subunit family amidase
VKEVIYASATTLARRIRDREVSSVEVVQAHLRRIEQVNPRLNAVVQLAAEQALGGWQRPSLIPFHIQPLPS